MPFSEHIFMSGASIFAHNGSFDDNSDYVHEHHGQPAYIKHSFWFFYDFI